MHDPCITLIELTREIEKLDNTLQELRQERNSLITTLYETRDDLSQRQLATLSNLSTKVVSDIIFKAGLPPRTPIRRQPVNYYADCVHLIQKWNEADIPLNDWNALASDFADQRRNANRLFSKRDFMKVFNEEVRLEILYRQSKTEPSKNRT